MQGSAQAGRARDSLHAQRPLDTAWSCEHQAAHPHHLHSPPRHLRPRRASLLALGGPVADVGRRRQGPPPQPPRFLLPLRVPRQAPPPRRANDRRDEGLARRLEASERPVPRADPAPQEAAPGVRPAPTLSRSRCPSGPENQPIASDQPPQPMPEVAGPAEEMQVEDGSEEEQMSSLLMEVALPNWGGLQRLYGSPTNFTHLRR